MSTENSLTPDQDMKLKLFLVKMAEPVRMWAESHHKDGRQSQPPIVWDSKLGDFVWLNRKQRRSK